MPQCTDTATLVSKANAMGNAEELQDVLSQALVVGFCVALIGSILVLKFPDTVLASVLKGKGESINMNIFYFSN